MSRWITRWRWGFGGVRRATTRAVRLVKEADQACERHHYEAALPMYEEILGLFRELEHWQGALAVRLRMGYLCSEIQKYQAAREHYEQAVSLARTLQSTEYLGAALDGFAEVAVKQSDYALAKRLCAECLQLWREQENAQQRASTYCLLGAMADTTTEARLMYERALTFYREKNHRSGIMAALCSHCGSHIEPQSIR